MGISWILIALVILIVFVFYKMRDFRHQVGLIVFAILIIFLLVSFGQLYASRNLDLNTFDGIMNAGKIYMAWLGAFGKNIIGMAGYAVHQDWTASNLTAKNNGNYTDYGR